MATKIRIRPWLRKFVNRMEPQSRFTNRQLCYRTMDRLGIDRHARHGYIVGTGDDEEIVVIPAINTMLNHVNHALNTIKDKEGGRIWYHDTKRIATWFHREHCTIEEGMRFYHYLKRKAKIADEEAEDVKRFMLARRRQERWRDVG